MKKHIEIKPSIQKQFKTSQVRSQRHRKSFWKRFLSQNVAIQFGFILESKSFWGQQSRVLRNRALVQARASIRSFAGAQKWSWEALGKKISKMNIFLRNYVLLATFWGPPGGPQNGSADTNHIMVVLAISGGPGTWF